MVATGGGWYVVDVTIGGTVGGGPGRVVGVVAPGQVGLQPVVGFGCSISVLGGPAGWVGPGPCTWVGTGLLGPTGWVSSLPHFLVTGFQIVPGGHAGGVVVGVGPPVGGGVVVVVVSSWGGSFGVSGTPGVGRSLVLFPQLSNHIRKVSPFQIFRYTRSRLVV